MVRNWTDEEIAESAQRAIDGLHEYCNSERDGCSAEETYRRFKVVHREEYDLVAVGKKWQVDGVTCLERFRSYHPFARFPTSERDPEVAEIFRVLREMRQKARERIAARSLAVQEEPARDYIDLDQAAALVNRSKRTLERFLGKMPNPVVQGAGGKKSEWVYEELRPWLEKEFGKILPKRPPHVAR